MSQMILKRLEISGLGVVITQCRVTGKVVQSGPIDFDTVKKWLEAGMPRPVDKHLPYPEPTRRLIACGISPEGWRILNEEPCPL